MPELPPDDPVISRSLADPLLVSAFLLMLTVGWSLYDEEFGLRPWRSYQNRFSAAYSAYLKKAVKQQEAAEKAVYSSPEYLQLKQTAEDLEKAAKPKDDEIQKKIELLDKQRAAMTDAFQDARGRVGALIYDYEIVPENDKRTKASRLKKVDDGKKVQYKINWPASLDIRKNGNSTTTT